MRVSETQAEAFRSLSAQHLSESQIKVMALFHDAETLLTREEISARTGLRLSSVCGRVRELLDAGDLKKRDKVRCIATDKMQERLGLPITQLQ